jgi:hypothetical protein
MFCVPPMDLDSLYFDPLTDASRKEVLLIILRRR